MMADALLTWMADLMASSDLIFTLSEKVDIVRQFALSIL
jgi:hypothetical protein